MHDVELAVESKHARTNRHDLIAGRKFRAGEACVSLIVGDLFQLLAIARDAICKVFAAGVSGDALVDIALITGVEDSCVNAQRSKVARESNLCADCVFLAQVWIADLERAGGLVRAFGEQLQRIGRAFRALQVQPAFPVAGHVKPQAGADADGNLPHMSASLVERGGREGWQVIGR